VLGHYWNRLIEPSPALLDETARGRARVVASLSLPVLLFAMASMLFARAPAMPFFIAVSVLALAAFVTSRTTYVWVAAVFIVIACVTTPYVGIFTPASDTSNSAEVTWLVLTVLAAGLCLPMLHFWIFGVLNIAIVAALCLQNPGIPLNESLETTALVLFVTVVTLIYVKVRTSSERLMAEAAAAETMRRKAMELEAVNAELVDAQEQLVQAAKLAAVGELAAGVAHELNNPLTAVMAYISVIKRHIERGETDHEPLYEHLDAMMEAADRCRDITAGLLKFSRGSSRKRESVDLAEVAHSAVTLAKPQLKRLKCEAVEEMEGPLRVTGNANRLEQVVINLLVNAGQALDKGGEIYIRGTASGNQAQLTVADTGCGMDEETQTRIFNPFFTTKPPGSGTGLGLSVSSGIVREHGGRIEVESSPGQGTTFTISLPLCIGEPEGTGEEDAELSA